MLSFQEITPQDKLVFDAFLRSRDFLGNHQNFATIYLWAKLYQQEWCLHDGWIIINTSDNFGFPFGEGDIRVPILAMKEHSDANGSPLTMWGMDDGEKAEMEAAFPGKFEFIETRQYFDYLYDIKKLISLEGKKLHAKRNFINRFEAQFPDWSFEPITKENLWEVKAMNQEWCTLNDWGHDVALQEESSAISRAFASFGELDFTGGLIRADGRVVAFSIASPLGTRAFDIHFEKAFYDVPGAYPIINREDDNGNEGLRKAKLSYHPEVILRKWLATWPGE